MWTTPFAPRRLDHFKVTACWQCFPRLSHSYNINPTGWQPSRKGTTAESPRWTEASLQSLESRESVRGTSTAEMRVRAEGSSLERSRKCLPSRQSFKSSSFDMATGTSLVQLNPKKDDASLAVGASAESNKTQKRVFEADLRWYNTYALFNGAGILSFLVYCALQKCQRGWVTNWTSFYLLKCRQIIFPCAHSWNVFASDSKLWMTSGYPFQCTVWSSWHSSPSVGADWEHAAPSGRDAKYMRRTQAQNSCQEDLWEKFIAGK